MTVKDIDRIERESSAYGQMVMSKTKDFHDGINTKQAYVAGAKAEFERMEDKLNTEKHLVKVYKMQASTAHAVIKELLRAFSFGEMELREMYVRHTHYKGSTYLWIMQEMLEKYKSYRDEL